MIVFLLAIKRQRGVTREYALDFTTGPSRIIHIVP